MALKGKNFIVDVIIKDPLFALFWVILVMHLEDMSPSTGNQWVGGKKIQMPLFFLWAISQKENLLKMQKWQYFMIATKCGLRN